MNHPRIRVVVDNDFSGDPDGLVQLAHHALSPSVDLRLVDDSLLVQVVDDGVGGADSEAGSGLRGLADRVEEARRISFHRDSRRKMFIHRRRAALFTLHCLQADLASCTIPAEKARLMVKLNRESEKLHRARINLDHVLRGPTHQEIADILHIPKGTVDSGFFYLYHALGFTCREDGVSDAS